MSTNTLKTARFGIAILFSLCLLGAPSILAARTLRLGMGDPMDSDQGAFAARFKALLESYSDGALTVNLFPGGALGAETEMIQNTRLGSLDMALVAVSNVTPFARELNLLAMPYVISSHMDAVKMTTGDLGQRWNEIATSKAGVRILGWTYSNFRHLTNSKRAITSLDDLKGLKVRVPQNRIMLATYKAWGANPVAMSWTETFTALQQQVVDGQDNPYIVNNSMKFHEVQSHLTEIHYLYALQPLLIGARAFAKMSPEQQAIFERAGLEAQQYALVYQLTEASKAKRRMQEQGVAVAVLEDEHEWMRIAREQVWPRFYDSIGGKAFLERVIQELQ